MTTSCATTQEDLAEPTFAEAEEAGEPEAAESEEPEAAPPDCSNQALWDSGFESNIEMFGCMGGFAKAGVPHSDAGGIVQWTGEKWETVPTDDVYRGPGMAGEDCYSTELLDRLGVPDEVRIFQCSA